MTLRILAACACAAALAACATPTVFAPVTGAQASGFWETRIEANRYRVSYRGGSGASPELVRDYALLHAADLTVADGYDWFEVVSGYGLAQAPRASGSVSIGGGGGSWGRHAYSGGGVGVTLPIDPGPQLVETIEIVLGKGARPDRPNVYDARSVQARLRPNLQHS